MDATQFDRLAERIAARLTRRAGLAVVAGVSLPLLGRPGSTAAKKKKKVTLCVNGQTTRAPRKKARKLLKRGATKGACPARCPTGQKACGGACIPTADCCGGCPHPLTCRDGMCHFAISLCGIGGYCEAFVSPVIYTGDLGGIAGADAICQSLATAQGHPGIFRAWLSTDSQSPESTFTNGPWRLRPNPEDGEDLPPLVATNLADLVTCGGVCIAHAINRTETGEILAGPRAVWTNTRQDGAAGSDSCANWTSTDGEGGFGSATEQDARWTAAGTSACSSARALYCFEQAP